MENKLSQNCEFIDAALNSRLTPEEEQLLASCEQTIEEKLKDFYDVGRALLTIQDRKLYRASYRTFAQYCRERWDFSRTHGYRNIHAWQSYQLVAHSEVAPTSERQLRPLDRLEPERWQEAWKTATSLATAEGTELTNRHVKKAVEEMLPVTNRRGKITKFSLRVCCVCQYHFSDEHHLKRQASGGKRFEAIPLYPNHHRYATLLQQMIDAEYSREDIEAFARQHFDLPFNEKLLNKLLDHSYHLSSTLTDSFSLLVDAASPDLEGDNQDSNQLSFE